LLQTILIKKSAHISVWKRMDAANPFQQGSFCFTVLSLLLIGLALNYRIKLIYYLITAKINSINKKKMIYL